MIKGARNFQQDFRPQLQRSDGKRVACLDERSTPDESRQTTIILRQEETNTSITDRCLCRCLDKLHTSRAEAAFATYRYLPPTQQRPRTSGASCWLCASTVRENRNRIHTLTRTWEKGKNSFRRLCLSKKSYLRCCPPEIYSKSNASIESRPKNL